MNSCRPRKLILACVLCRQKRVCEAFNKPSAGRPWTIVMCCLFFGGSEKLVHSQSHIILDFFLAYFSKANVLNSSKVFVEKGERKNEAVGAASRFRVLGSCCGDWGKSAGEGKGEKMSPVRGWGRGCIVCQSLRWKKNVKRSGQLMGVDWDVFWRGQRRRISKEGGVQTRPSLGPLWSFRDCFCDLAKRPTSYIGHWYM